MDKGLTPAISSVLPVSGNASEIPDHLIHVDGVECAGQHWLVDMWGAERLGDPEYIERVLRTVAIECGATILHAHFHRFGDGCGVSGVVVLAESHESVHTWPERGFAAFDVFMCGSAHPERAVEILRGAFRPQWFIAVRHLRGKPFNNLLFAVEGLLRSAWWNVSKHFLRNKKV